MLEILHTHEFLFSRFSLFFFSLDICNLTKYFIDGGLMRNMVQIIQNLHVYLLVPTIGEANPVDWTLLHVYHVCKISRPLIEYL